MIESIDPARGLVIAALREAMGTDDAQAKYLNGDRQKPVEGARLAAVWDAPLAIEGPAVAALRGAGIRRRGARAVR